MSKTMPSSAVGGTKPLITSIPRFHITQGREAEPAYAMYSFQYGTSIIDYSLVRGNKKNVSVSVNPKGQVHVKAPEHLSENIILDAVKSKARWITARRFEVREIETRCYHRDYVNGESFLYLGRRYSLQIIEDTNSIKPQVKLYRGKLLITTPLMDEEILKMAIQKWYKEKASEKIPERVAFYERFFIEKRGKVFIKEQKKRWGSCTKEGTLTFNWKSIMAPANILDYIIVHEMCHLRYMNHSKEFWEMLGRILPDYESRKEWLKNNGILLEI